MADHRRVFAIALPMMISNIAAPMLGLIDTAIIGHLPEAIYLSAVAVGAMAINFVYLLAIFLRMSTTGVVAHAYGAKDLSQQQRHWNHGLLFALILGVIIIVAAPLVLFVLWSLVDLEAPVKSLTTQYIDIRIWGAPAALINLVVLGVLLGRQQAKTAMFLVIFINLVNVVGDVILIIGLNLHVVGAAYASLIAEWSTAMLGFFLVNRSLCLTLARWPRALWSETLALAGMNSDIFIRSVCLQLCIAMMTGYATYYGAITVAANAVLMQFLVLIALGLDGIAYAVEALIGQAKGQKNQQRIQHWFRLSLFWSFMFALVYSLIFFVFGSGIIRLITNIPEVINTAEIYLPWLIILPLVAHWSYFYDGVFIGLSASKGMRNTMLFSTLCVFFPVWWLSTSLENHGLWLALVCFMAGRGLSQFFWLQRHQEKLFGLPSK
ncbi:MATE family efflux transporter [Aliidiomarina halalkaliphila]|uniref:MATE family efflux transporter n=2 Tax=Aliidiomarina halalkaliphila TaxID=2593535 RepID=A0A552X271_9GAMM|nr:MATE family efflux transporter [Aliidiomarina halalkaliphila]